ncbi:MAG TPA: PIG-L family deacetylase [Mobilitalea sp.]|nr:PIG-L family deacetylase [Mobilitalea sp.]
MDRLSLISLLEQKNSFKTTLTGVVPAKRVLVMAPHHDDEAVGCGGSILRYLDLNASITITYLTDGRYGMVGNEAGVRQKEALEAWKGYPVKQLFWNFEDSHMEEEPVRTKMVKLIEDLKPEVIYVPWPIDRHIDHKMTGYFLAGALERLNTLDIIIGSYEVMYPLYANKVVDISKQIEKKLEIISAYESQIKYLNLEQVTETSGLLRACATQLKSMKSAEAFYVCDSKSYVDFVRKVFDL